MSLDDLIKEATLNVRPASHGQRFSDHEWVPIDGGRACPRGGEGSQTLYECRVCGELDYGDPTGPGFHDCFDDIDGCAGCFTVQELWDTRDNLDGKTWDPLEQYKKACCG
jgi:hypothetical protein